MSYLLAKAEQVVSVSTIIYLPQIRLTRKHNQIDKLIVMLNLTQIDIVLQAWFVINWWSEHWVTQVPSV